MIRALLLMLIWSGLSLADTINLGLVSFNVLIPGDGGLPGVNYFNVLNLTGDPGDGGSGLPPDFPAITSLMFLGSTLTLIQDSSSQIVTLGDLGPGPLSSTAGLEFADTEIFTSAIFAAMLNQTSFALADGRMFLASSLDITATLLPSLGGALAPDFDFVLLQASGTIEPIPEPQTVFLLLGAIVFMATLAAKRARRIVR